MTFRIEPKPLYVVLFVVLFLLEPDYISSLNAKQLSLYSSLFLLSVAIHFFHLRKEKNWFRLDVIFILGFSIVHFQWPIMFAFSDIYPKGLFREWSDSDYMNYGTWLSTLGGISWLYGYSLISLKTKAVSIKYVFNYSLMFWFALASYVMFLLTIGGQYWSGTVYKYGLGDIHETIGAYFGLLTSISILVLTTFIIISKKDKYRSNILDWLISLDKKYLLIAASYVFLHLAVGDRGGAIILSLAFLILFGQLVRPIKLIELISIVIIGTIILTLIGFGRTSDSEKNILIAGAEKAEFTSGYDVTVELANSARTLYKSLSNVPEQHDYFYGKLWVSDLLAIAPFATSAYLKLSGDATYGISSAAYITYLTLGPDPPWGEGTTLIADIYLNFGLVGVVLFLLLLGMFFKKAHNELVIQKNYYWLVVAGLLASGTLYTSRGGLFDMLRPIIWGLLFVFLFVKQKRSIV